MEEKNKKKSFWHAIRKRIKISNLIILIILLAGNSFAWFVYVKDVQNSINVHVRAWDVILESNQGVISEIFTMNVEKMYPGMSNYVDHIQVYNQSEMGASVDYEILSVTMLGQTKYTVEGVTEYGITPTGEEKTSVEMARSLANDYPFLITIDVSDPVVDATVGRSTYTLTVEWPYESGDDAADTKWGTDAYTFNTAHPSDPTISLVVKVSVVQSEE